jgi:hypothetical protein
MEDKLFGINRLERTFKCLVFLFLKVLSRENAWQAIVRNLSAETKEICHLNTETDSHYQLIDNRNILSPFMS